MSTEDDRAPAEEPARAADPVGAAPAPEPETAAAQEVSDVSAPEAEPEAAPEPVSTPEPEATAEAEAAPEPDAAPEPETEPHAAAEPGAVPAPGPSAEPGPEFAGDEESGDELGAGRDSGLPDIEDDEALEAALEALLLVVDSPASEESLAETLEQPVARVSVALSTMAQKFTERVSGIDLRRVGEGWRFYTRDTYAPFVEKLLLDGQRSKLTRAALESLAVIAYRQPVTRARVAAVRGVNVDGVIRTLLARGLIEEMGTDPETTGTLYVTTELFLERLGLSSLNDLPPIAPLLPEVDSIDDI
ncbi:hypothetical protein GCM10022222_76320 [Amycolatopsis ultiminotia]|uniref:Segregation and condensation protein B n=1 Tax=Amycolatopsis ultiminotia TaxID=543629 RepID=A0ABP6YB26_9PSEU